MMERGTPNNASNHVNTGDTTMNTISIGSVGLALPVTSGMDPSNALSAGTISVACSAGEAVAAQPGSLQAPPQHIQIPATAMSIGSLAVAMGLPGARADPNHLTFTSNTLASLTARMGISSMAGSSPGGLVAAGNSLLTFPGSAALNIVPSVGLGPAGVSIVDGTGLSMTVAGGMAMQAATNLNIVGVQTSGDIANTSSIIGAQQQQQQGHPGASILQNNVHINGGGASLVNNVSGGLGGSGHASGGCCGGCRTRVTVKDQASQTDLSTVIQMLSRPAYQVPTGLVPPHDQNNKFIEAAQIVKAEERLARSGLMPGARLISSSPGSSSAVVNHTSSSSSHHGPNFPCSCDFCGRVFAKKEYLRRHIRIHTGERPYKCVICGHSFRRSHHLRCHELTHTGTKPFSCGICGKAFNLSHHLRRHEMTHTGEKPYACTECGKAFTRKQHLDRHYKTHTGEYHRTFKCPFCEKMFFRAHHRDKHMKRHVSTSAGGGIRNYGQSPLQRSPRPSTNQQININDLNLSVRRDGTLQADGMTSSPISAVSRDNSHSSDDYLTSDEEGKVHGANKLKEGSKKRKGSSPMRLRFPYDYNAKEVPESVKAAHADMMEAHGGSGSSHDPGLVLQTNVALSTPSHGQPKGSKSRGSGAARSKKKAGGGSELVSRMALGLKSDRLSLEGAGYGVVNKDGEVAAVYAGKIIPNIPQHFVSESVVVRHTLQGGQQQQLGGLTADKGLSVKQDESTQGAVPTSTPDGRGAASHQWQQQQQQMGLNSLGGADYMPGINNRQLHTSGSAISSTGGNSGSASGESQQTMHYKPASTVEQNLHHSWPAAASWPRLTLTSDPVANSYSQLDASRFMNIYGASKVMEMRMADLHGPQNFDGGHWSQGRRDQGQDKGDSRIYSMHQ